MCATRTVRGSGVSTCEDCGVTVRTHDIVHVPRGSWGVSTVCVPCFDERVKERRR